MIVTNLVSVTRKKDSQSKFVYESSYNPKVLSKIDNLDKIIVMSGTAKRKPLGITVEPPIEEKKDTDTIEFNFECDKFSKLKPPCNTPRNKNNGNEEKMMNKSCEIIFECIKPYKDITPDTTKLWQSSETTKSILRTNEFIYEKKATRKVQFLGFGEDKPTTLFDEIEYNRTQENNNVDVIHTEDPVTDAQEEASLSPKSKRSRKTISSEDFINNAFSKL